MGNKESEAGSQAGTIQELDRVRDIIFGPQMRDYQQRFQLLDRDLKRLEQEIDRLRDKLTQQLAELDSAQNQKLQTLSQELRQADADLRAEERRSTEDLTTSKVDRAALGELFVEIGTRLKGGASVAELLGQVIEARQDEGREQG